MAPAFSAGVAPYLCGEATKVFAQLVDKLIYHAGETAFAPIEADSRKGLRVFLRLGQYSLPSFGIPGKVFAGKSG